MGDDVVAMRPESMVSAAHFLRDQAETLNDGLGHIAAQWSALSATWTGPAASAYRPLWESWHDGARTITAILAETADLLVQAASLFSEHDRNAADAMDSLS